MLKSSLRFAIVVEAEFIHRTVVDSPGMADVPLLESLFSDRSETGHVRAGSLKLRKRRNYVVIVEIVVEAEVLFVIDAMIDSYRELVATGGLDGNSLNEVACRARRGKRNKLQQVYCSRIEAFQGNLVARKDVTIENAVSNRSPAHIGNGLLAASPLPDSTSI